MGGGIQPGNAVVEQHIDGLGTARARRLHEGARALGKHRRRTQLTAEVLRRDHLMRFRVEGKQVHAVGYAVDQAIRCHHQVGDGPRALDRCAVPAHLMGVRVHQEQLARVSALGHAAGTGLDRGAPQQGAVGQLDQCLHRMVGNQLGVVDGGPVAVDAVPEHHAPAGHAVLGRPRHDHQRT